jgi:hypothetical protein
VDDAMSILSIHGKKEFVMQYLEDYFNHSKCNDVLKIYMETVLKSEGEQAVINKIDSIFEDNQVPVRELSENGHIGILSKNVFTSEINSGSDTCCFSTSSIIDIKGNSSFKEKFFKNEHMSNNKGIDYSKRVATSNTSLIEISTHEDKVVKKNSQNSFLDIITGSFRFFTNQIRGKEPNQNQQQEEEEEEHDKNIIGTELDLDGLFNFEIPESSKQIDLFEETQVNSPKLVDIFSNDYTQPIISQKDKDQFEQNYDKVYQDISLDSYIVNKLFMHKAKMLSKTRGKGYGRDYLIANRDFFGKKLKSILFKYYQKCYDIEEILKLDNIYFGTFKRKFFDSMNIKEVTLTHSN